jgi:hypothetical protein
MVGRLRETGISFVVGEAGLLKHALVPMVLFAAAVGLLLLRGSAHESAAPRSPWRSAAAPYCSPSRSPQPARISSSSATFCRR